MLHVHKEQMSSAQWVVHGLLSVYQFRLMTERPLQFDYAQNKQYSPLLQYGQYTNVGKINLTVSLWVILEYEYLEAITLFNILKAKDNCYMMFDPIGDSIVTTASIRSNNYKEAGNTTIL